MGRLACFSKSCGQNLSKSRGMTLIEMLVVLLIVGLLVSVTVLSTGLINRGDSSESGVALSVAEDLSRLFEHASQQAVAKNEVLGWSLQNDQQMVWWRWSSMSLTPVSSTQTQSAASGRVPDWMVDESVMKALDLPDNIQLHVTSDTTSDRGDGNLPAVVFFPGREYSAFEVYVRDSESARALARVWPGRDGLMNWSAL